MITKIPIHLLFIEDDGYHLQAKAYINRKKANVLIDTGASRSVFDKNRITHFVGEKVFDLNEKLSTGLGTNTMESHSVLLKSFKLGELKLRNYPSLLLDLNHVNNSYEQLGLQPIDGIIGSDILVEYKAIINYETKLLRLKFPSGK